MGLFIRKPFEALQAEANASGKKTLKRVLGPWSLVALGVGVIIGAGLFSITGTVAAGYTGPAITLSFAIAALGCCFAGLCYAEFASMIPVAGSAYTYSYATMGELIAWIIGWDLVLEYTVAATTVSISWSRYLVVFLEGLDIHLPQVLTACPWDGGVVNIPAFLIVVLMSLFLIRGTEGSSIFNGFIVFLKVSVILIFVILGWKYINTDNYTPYIPANTGVLGEYGFSGILRGAAIVFFAFLGFDAVSTAAQETKNPKRNMPIGILVSLLVCTVLYMVFAHVMTGVAHYTAFSGQQGIAPVAIAIEHMGQADAAGIIQPDYPWLNRAIVLSILFGYCSVIMVTLLGQSRVFLSMSHDGLLPPFFSHINEKFRTPARSNLLFMVLVGLLAAFVPARLAGEMTSIGTLMAFTLVCAAVLVVRRTMPDVPRSFKTPLVPLIPILGILTCLCMMLFLPADTWIRLVLWMLIGLDIYVGYGMKHSKLEHGGDTRHGQVTLNMIGLILAVLCVITGLWHQQTVGWGESKVLLIISFFRIHALRLLYVENLEEIISPKSPPLKINNLSSKLPQHPLGPFPETTVCHCHQKPGSTESDDCGTRYLKIDRNMDSTHQDYARSGKEIVYHIDSKTTERQVCQCFLDALRTEIGPLAKHKHGDSHHYYIQRTVGKEEFEHLIRKIRQGSHMAETKECYGIANGKHGNADATELPARPVMVPQIMAQQ